jgi:hypothetical protein
MTLTQARRVSAGVLVVLLTGAWIQQPPQQQPQQPAPSQTATDFYKQYLDAFTKATTLNDLLPYVSAERRREIEGTPALQRPRIWQGVKTMQSMFTDITVVNEEQHPDGRATLTLSAIDADKKKVTGKVEMLNEKGSWKVGPESWSSY